MTIFVKARDVSFGVHGRRLVAEATLRLALGRLTIVIGQNGAGKSTLLKLLTGEMKPSRGEIFYAGESLLGISAWRLACWRAVMAQGVRLAFPFSVYEIARIGLDRLGRSLTSNRIDAIVTESLATADLLHLANRSYVTLSGGERQRAQFARVLCQLKAGQLAEQRQALFLDEPISSLDLCHQLALMDAVRDVADRGVAVLAVLHDLNVAAAYADDLIVMAGGRIVTQGPPADVLTDALVSTVFRVDLQIGAALPSSLPFVLPQRHARRQNWSRIRFSAPCDKATHS